MARARPPAPATEAELLRRATALAGRTLAQIAASSGWTAPRHTGRFKGWAGELIEFSLGADAGTRPEPDFRRLAIELKTLPLDARGRPAESTFVCNVAIRGAAGSWERSGVRRKLARVLWVPIEAEAALPLPQRRVGNPWLWSPDRAQEAALRADWEELTGMMATEGVEGISARHGRFLQIRPKAAHSRVLTRYADRLGGAAQTNPRGFYLRTAFTRTLLEACAGAASRR